MERTMIMLAVMLGTMLGVFAHAEEQKYMPMPPAFSAQANPEETLRTYPLGVITKQAAFSHHGQATRAVKLPNGNEGWVYQSGEESGLRTYTLEFDGQDRVVDVLYNERGRHNGMTALQVQAQAAKILGPEAEPAPFEKHSSEEYRQSK
ncbi:MAG: hypothetical protein HZB57_12715 [Gammaproteobacteria bacterium]|nr:hypothetical protein [Gammaproteobacteria bacterium]